MKTFKLIFMVLFTIAIVNTGYSQVGNNYKQPFNKAENKREITSSNVVSAINYKGLQNYKQVAYKVNVVQKMDNLICCSGKSANAFFSSSNYKQPYSTPLEKECNKGFVCNNTIKLDCCKL